MAAIRTLNSAPPTERVNRYPKHTFRVNSLPFTAQPFFLARVLPGETLNNLFFESRVITDPIRNSIIGWKKEYFFYYVKMSDLGIPEFKQMFVDPNNTDLITSTAYETVSNIQRTYTAKGGIDWADRCLTRIVDEYFRDQGEVTADFKTTVTFPNTPIVQIRESSWLDSITDDSVMPEGAAISGATDMGDLDRLYNAFEQLRAMGLSDMTYEDFLRAQGIHIPERDENRPVQIAHFSDFTYPSNTVTQGTGAVTSACSWVFKNGTKKPYFFKEPGFILGITVTRPKTYFAGLAGKLADFATRAWDWMPFYMMDMPETSLKYFAPDTGPLGDRTTPTDDHWVDMRDELLYGDQFQNVIPFNAVPVDVGTENMLSYPSGATATQDDWKYPLEPAIKQLFVTPASAFYVKEDGYVSLSIKGKQVDYTRGTISHS